MTDADGVYREVRSFLLREARLVDDREFEAWLDCMTEDVTYEIPIRTVRDRDVDEPFLEMGHVEDDRYRLEKRLERLRTDYAWSDNPPSRTRHFVSNIEIDAVHDDELDVISYLLLARAAGDDPGTDLLSGKREDVLRRVDGDLKLAERRLLLDQTAIPFSMDVFV